MPRVKTYRHGPLSKTHELEDLPEWRLLGSRRLADCSLPALRTTQLVRSPALLDPRTLAPVLTHPAAKQTRRRVEVAGAAL